MDENRNVCPCCGRHCDLNAPSCEMGREYVRTGVMPERDGPGPHGPGPHGPGPHGPGPHGPGPHGPGPHGPGPHGPGPHGPGPHGPGPHGPGPHGPGPHGPGSHGPGPHGPHGPRIDPEQYQKLDTDGKLLAMLHMLGHASRFHFDGLAGQNRVLHILEQEGSMTQRELTERMGIQPGSASEVIGKLERAGLVVRTTSETDRRTADIALTEAGRIRRQERREQEQARRLELFAALTEEEKQTLLALLEKLYAAWQPDRPIR